MYLAFLLVLSALKLSAAVTCHPPQFGILPTQPDCAQLVYALLQIPRIPSARATRSWGRDLDNSGGKVHLPKIYWIAGEGLKTCGVLVDNDNLAPHAIERFGLGAIGHAADHILKYCLFRKGEVGMERLGEGKMVIASVVRIDKGVLLRAGREALSEVVVGNGTVLWSSVLDSTGFSTSLS